jgi:3-oxoacyl-[acyl-carrier protein] reductase
MEVIMELTGKIAIVTGAAQGLGAAIARRLDDEGASVIVADINAQAAAATSEKLNGDSSSFWVDISDIDALGELMRFTIKKYGRLDVLVNNAGIAQQIDFFDIMPEQFDKLMNVNLKGMVFLSQLAMKHMTERGSGRIVNIASLAGERGGQFAGIHYSCSKAGVIVATKCMAYKGGPYGVTVNAVAPGLIATELAEKLHFSTDEIAMKRLGTAQEVADAVEFLCSDRASYITGTTLDVNGGIFMR